MSFIMMIENVRDEELLETTKRLVAEERLKTLEVISHLQEIYDRRLHWRRGFASLHEFLVGELKYSDGAAHRRISAMRLVADVPETKAMVADGKLSLTTAATVQNFFNSESKRARSNSFSPEAKLGIIESVAGASRQECERKLGEIAPHYAKKSRLLVLESDDELSGLMEEYRKLAMLSDGSPKSIIRDALVTALRARKVRATSKAPAKWSAQIESKAEIQGKAQTQTKPQAQTRLPDPQASPEKLNSRYVKTTDRSAVWRESAGRCTYTDPQTKRRCGATHRLEIDHVLPFVFDGPTHAQNLRLLCRAHNQMRAAEEFGGFNS